jgi:ubiquitin-conjugating enzyme E2 J1
LQFKPPHILFLTPSGRFDTNTKICLSFSAFHPELWQPAWGIRLILEALIAFLPSPADGAIGALDWTPEERKRLAKKSVSFCCPRCGKVASLLPEPASNEEKKPSRFQKEIEQLRLAQISNETKDADIKKGVDDKVSSETLPLTLEQGTPPSTCPVPQTPDPATPVATPMEPTQDTATGARIMEEHNPTAPAVEEAEQENPYEVDLSWLTDPMLNVSIVLLSAICVLLVRKAHALLDELSALDAGRS